MMAPMGHWRSTAAFAWRDLRWSRARAGFLVVAMTVSAASISGVRGAANIARSALGRESRSWLAGDLAVSTGEPLDDVQREALDRMRAQGIQSTEVTTALTMGGSAQSPNASLLAVKAVDPGRYPFYGALLLAPPLPLSKALQPDTAALSKDAMAQFHLRLGDRIRIGEAQFRVSAVIAAEPDRFSGATILGVRCLLSRPAFERSGVARSGDSLRFRILFRLPPSARRPAFREALRQLFPDADVADFRDANRNAVSILETTALFLNLAALLALALGAIGIAAAARQHVEERAYTLAVMKILGGRNHRLAAMFFLQIACLAAIGLALGLLLGWAVRASLLSFASRYVVLPEAAHIDYPVVFETAAAGLAALAPALAVTVLAIRRLKPAVLLRRDFEDITAAGGTLPAFAWVVSGLVLGAIAFRLLGSWSLTTILIASLAAGAGAALLLVQALIGIAWRCSHASVLCGIPILRHGIANLCRPGNRVPALIVALSIGVMMLVSTFELERSVTSAILGAIPFDHPGLLIPAIEASHVAEVRDFLERQPGVEKVEVGAQARGRLTTADGAHVGSIIACAAGEDEAADVAEDLARRFHLHPGSRLQFRARGRTVSSLVSAVRRMNAVEETWYAVRMDCRGLDPGSLFYHAAARIRPDCILAVRHRFLAEFPALPVGTAEDLSEIVGQVSHDALLLARLVAWYTLGSGLAVLIAIVSASRGPRLREMAILSALGARRGTVIRLYSVEFAAIGVLAAIIGNLLAFGFSAVAVGSLLRRPQVSVGCGIMPVAIAGLAGMTVVAGWLPACALLRRKPLEALRAE